MAESTRLRSLSLVLIPSLSSARRLQARTHRLSPSFLASNRQTVSASRSIIGNAFGVVKPDLTHPKWLIFLAEQSSVHPHAGPQY